MANISAAASVLFYAYLSALGFFCPFRLTFHFQNTVDVLLDNVVFLDLLFQFSIVGIQGFFLFLKCCVLYLQGGNAWELGDAIAQMKAPLPLVDILKVSDEELPLLTGTTDCESGTAQLAQNGIRLIFVTLGANGVFYRFGDKTGHVAGVPCKVGDTNGAGDTFFGAALSKLCKEELDTLTVDKLEGILAFANKAASITTSRHGAIPAMPTLAEVEG